MTNIASAAHFRQRVVRYAQKHGVTCASLRHRVSRNAIYEWRARYNGHWKSLVEKSHRPHSHPKQHSEEGKLIEDFPFPIREIQTDNGTEWTNALLVKHCAHKSLFEQALEDMDIRYHRIRIATPRHNGKVERQHTIDEKRFYKKMKLYSLADGRKQLLAYNKKSNHIPKICLNFNSPNEILEKYLGVM